MDYVILTQSLRTEGMCQYRKCYLKRRSNVFSLIVIHLIYFQFWKIIGRKLRIFAALLVISTLDWQWLTAIALMISVVTIVKQIFFYWVSIILEQRS